MQQRNATATTGLETTPEEAHRVGVGATVTGALVTALVGLYLVGFAALPAVHNTFHHVRHGFAFPCH